MNEGERQHELEDKGDRRSRSNPLLGTLQDQPAERPRQEVKPKLEADDPARDAQGQAPQADPTADSAEHVPEKSPMSRGRRILFVSLGLIVLGALITGGVLYWLNARQFETTDDAFIEGYRSQVASQVSGRVLTLLIRDNQHVEAGQPLLTIDPADYQVRLEQARAQAANAAAQLEQARADLLMQRANVEQLQAQVRVAETEFQQAQQDLARYRGVNPAAITRQQLDQSSATTRSANARLDSARQAVNGGRAQVDSQQARIAAAEASVRQSQADVRNAELQLSYTGIVAPQAGRVTRRAVNLGDFITPGQALLAVVPDEMWVTANFKETQLTRMQVGQPVEITVDAYADQVLHGRVESMQRGTGAAFSSLPAENATGNYVKVVQRVPVKIVFDSDDYRSLPLALGLSVRPRVTVR